MAETPKELKKENIFHDYCWTWKLKVNIDKTKIVCSTNGRLPQNLHFTNSNNEFEIVKEFNYLGILLTNKENFKRELKTLAEKGTKSNVGNSEKRRMPQSFYVMST
jgi:glutaredoxin-related protein